MDSPHSLTGHKLPRTCLHGSTPFENADICKFANHVGAIRAHKLCPLICHRDVARVVREGELVLPGGWGGRDQGSSTM
eukprot:713675-Amorphochlora_amoeboformis.AAC.2